MQYSQHFATTDVWLPRCPALGRYFSVPVMGSAHLFWALCHSWMVLTLSAVTMQCPADCWQVNRRIIIGNDEAWISQGLPGYFAKIADQTAFATVFLDKVDQLIHTLNGLTCGSWLAVRCSTTGYANNYLDQVFVDAWSDLSDGTQRGRCL